MADAFLRRFTRDVVEVSSAGTTAADRLDSGVVAAMAEVNIDIAGALHLRRTRRTWDGVGTALLHAIEARARRNAFHKIVSFALGANEAGQHLYRKVGYREVGIFNEQGRLDGRFVDVIVWRYS